MTKERHKKSTVRAKATKKVTYTRKTRKRAVRSKKGLFDKVLNFFK